MKRQGPGRPQETSREEIKTVARRLFEKQGYAATSLVQIAREVGVSRTTLFSYFPAKRDLLWDEFEAGEERLWAAVAAARDRPLIEILGAGLIATADYPISEHDGLRLRWRLTLEDPQLRAYTAMRTEQLLANLVDHVRLLAPTIDPELIDHVARALIGVAGRCTEVWAQLEAPPEDLGSYVAKRLEPFITALSPLLETRIGAIREGSGRMEFPSGVKVSDSTDAALAALRKRDD